MLRRQAPAPTCAVRRLRHCANQASRGGRTRTWAAKEGSAAAGGRRDRRRARCLCALGLARSRGTQTDGTASRTADGPGHETSEPHGRALHLILPNVPYPRALLPLILRLCCCSAIASLCVAVLASFGIQSPSLHEQKEGHRCGAHPVTRGETKVRPSERSARAARLPWRPPLFDIARSRPPVHLHKPAAP